MSCMSFRIQLPYLLKHMDTKSQFQQKLDTANFLIFLLLNFWYLLFIVPSSPLNITNIHTKNDSVTLHWKEPESPNGIIIGYRLYYMTKKMTDVQTVKDSSKEIVYMLKNLSKLPPLS